MTSTSTPVEAASPEDSKLVTTRSGLPKFLTLRADSQQPERFLQNLSVEEVKATVARQVRANGRSNRYIAVYQLSFVEVHEPSSKTLTPEQFDELMKEQWRLEQEVQNDRV